MPQITAAAAGGANVLAFLDMIAWAEGTSTSRHTLDDGYDVIVNGINSPLRMTSYLDHPRVLVTVNRQGLKSTAAGRYQLLSRYWNVYRRQLGLLDFSPLSQDKVALQQICEQQALGDIQAGRFDLAVGKCSNIWASFPGAGYGQREHRLANLQGQYVAAGGALA